MFRIVIITATVALAGCQHDPNRTAAAFQAMAAQGAYMPPVQAPAYRAPGPCFTRAAPTLYGAPVMQTVCW